MTRLSFPIERISAHYTVVIVGSGYGGAIAASRLARAGQRVCVLERGREIVAGELPRTAKEVAAESQIDTPLGKEKCIGPPNGLYHFHVDERMNVLVGCGLGGTSLINANVVIRPDPRVFEDPRWPEAIRKDADGLFAAGFDHAERMLGVAPYPDSLPLPPKAAVLRAAGEKIGQQVRLVPVAVTFHDGPNRVGVQQNACKMCGDCVTGCNHGAKNTLVMNYLPDARRHGAEIFTEVEVRRIERQEGRWLVHYRVLGAGLDGFRDAPDLVVTAEVVVLAAGVLGTTEILLRSRRAGLSMSEQVGRHFSSNRNVLGFGYNAAQEVRAVGFGDRPADRMAPVGPLITSAVDMRDTPNVNDGLIIEEGVVPGALAEGFLAGIMKAAAVYGEVPDRDLEGHASALERTAESLFEGAYRGAIAHTMTLLAMGHDDSPGRIFLEDDHLRIEWPAGSEQSAVGPTAAMERIVHAASATFVPNPLWKALPWHPMIAVQPLGGCVLGEDAEQGAVNHKGQLFSGPCGTGVYENLYVLDGSILPRSTGLNPLLTISALAERAVRMLARDRGWDFSYDFPASPHVPEPAAPPQIRFSEAMRGHYGPAGADEFRQGADKGKAKGTALEVFLRVLCDDDAGETFDPMRPFGVVGVARAPALSPAPLAITGGTCVFFAPDPGSPLAKTLEYRFTMTSTDGRPFFVEGTKRLQDDPGPDMLSDVTTLFVTLYDGPDSRGPVHGRGVLEVGVRDFAHQLTTFAATGNRSEVERAAAIARFGAAFGLRMLRPYAGLWDRLTGLFSS